MHAFASADRVRRLTGAWLDAAGLGPRQTPSRRVHAQPGFELLGYGEPSAPGPVVLLLPAPIKRAYIWDLVPALSVVRRCLERRLRVHLLRWTGPAGEADGELGLADYADRLVGDALGAIEAETGERRLVLAGHSLGGTFAALFAAARPERVRGLVLLEAPLHFGAAGAGAFAPMVAAAPPARTLTRRSGGVPGTWLDVAAMTAAPDVFVWDRWVDRVASAWDPERLLLHYRVERWTLDELPLSRRLFEDVVELLYREDRFMRGTLTLDGREVRPAGVTAPILAVVDPRSRVVPVASVRPFLDAAGTRDTTLLEYGGDTGVSLQHVGVLVGPAAHRRLWPRILDWIAAVAQPPARGSPARSK
jgi:polyhydroxyalkanoate synthase